MIYFPMAADIMTPGRIKCLIELKKIDKVIVGLLTSKAMKGHRTEVIPFKSRLYVLEAVCKGIGGITIVSQGSIDPTKNLKRYKCEYIASGDGFDLWEMKAMEKLGVKPLHIRLPSERGRLYDINKIRNEL
jgi:glycerol-3-phosphate cytidylyltransferase-like family protein